MNKDVSSSMASKNAKKLSNSKDSEILNHQNTSKTIKLDGRDNVDKSRFHKTATECSFLNEVKSVVEAKSSASVGSKYGVHELGSKTQ